MKILIANGQLALIGGMETYLKGFAHSMRARGHEVRVAAEHGFGLSPGRSWCPEGIQAVPLLSTIQANGGDWKPDVVLCNPLSNPRLEERLVELAPMVFFAHTFFGTCVSGTKMHAFPSRRPCTRRFGFACLALYWPRRCGGWNPITALSLFRKERRRRRVLGRVQRILVASHFMETELTRNGVDPSSIEVVGFPSTEIGASPDSSVLTRSVLFVGRLTRVKGVDLLLEAAALLASGGTRLTVVIAGEGAERRRLMHRASSLGIDVAFLGWVSPVERQKLFERAACVAVPSVWPEPFGLVGLEAVSTGIPVVAFDVGGVREWLAPGVNGALAPADPPTAEGFAQALERTLALRQRWESSREQRTALLAAFNSQKHFDRMEEILARCAGHR